MKTNVSIKFNSIEEYREIERKLIEMGYVNDKNWNKSTINKITNKILFSKPYYVHIEGVNIMYFSIYPFSNFGKEKIYNSLQEFLNDLNK